MKTFSCILSLLLLSAFIACNGDKKKPETKDTTTTATATPAPPKVEEQPAAEPDSATAMQNWIAYATPGDVHKMMAESDGVWIEEMTSWMNPDGPPSKHTLTATNKMMLDGRYQESVHKGSFEGMPFEGRSTMGYDNITKKFQSTWVDNMGTGIMFMEGTLDPQTQVITLSGKGIDAATGQEVIMRETFKIVDKNTQEMVMYCTKKGKEEFKQMEMKLTRKNKKA